MKNATGTNWWSHEKSFSVNFCGFSASTEKLPSESPNWSILMVAPVTPGRNRRTWLFGMAEGTLTITKRNHWYDRTKSRFLRR